MAKRKADDKEPQQHKYEYKYTISYSPNFHRHIVSKATPGNENARKTVVESFCWLDQALRAYPTATLEPLDMPPPPISGKTNDNDTFVLSDIVAGAGILDATVYYRRGDSSTDNANANATATAARNPNNGGSYLLRFLLKLYTTWPTLNPATIHRTVMDRFPRVAFYDAALVHERLFFLLSPLPPPELIPPHNNTAIDFPMLFYKYGYGAGLTPRQLVQALQTLPQYWLSIYFSDALASCRRPQDFLPYIYHQLNSHPDALRKINHDLDPLLVGVVAADVASLAHAQSSLQITAEQCRWLLQALPSLRTCQVDPHWELFLQGPVRPQLKEDALAYLRLRLQLDPPQVVCMIKTYTRLSHKGPIRLKKTLDFLQVQLQLTSQQLQQLMLRMPSLLGSSTVSLEKRIQFLQKEVGLTLEEVKTSTLALPALLQYGLENLQAKLDFFRNDLQIHDPKTIVYMVTSRPDLWGLSLDKNLRPTVVAMQNYLDISPSQAGEILGRAPALFLHIWSSNLEPKLDFLTSRLGLSSEQRKQLLLHQPRILTFSLHKSLDAKITMIEEHLSQTHQRQSPTTVRDVILNNPSLLVMSKAALELRFQKSGISAGQVGRAKRCVVQLSMNGTVQREFSSVKDAAKSAGTGASRMYQVIRQGEVFGDCQFVYQLSPGEALSAVRPNRGEQASSTAPVINCEEPDNERYNGHEGDTIDTFANGHCEPTTTDTSYLRVYASARVYPPDGTTQARGLRRGGGIAIVMPGLPPSLAHICQQAMEEGSQGQLLSLKHDQDDDGEVLLALSGYPLLRPSRRRCSLFACLVALRVVSRFCHLVHSNEQAANKSQPNGRAAVPHRRLSLPSQIDIVTDSSYVFGLLNDTARLLEWATARTQLEFVYDGDESTSWANTDIIWPLSRAYYKLVSGPGDDLPNARRGNSNTTVRFVLQANHLAGKKGHATHVHTSAFRRQVDSWAKEAASVQYQRISIAGGSS